MSESKSKPCVTLPAASNPPPDGQWSTGLYDCWDDPSNCFITCCFPCVTMGRIAEVVDKGSISCAVAGTIYCALGPDTFGKLYAYSYRSKLRGLFGLPEAPYSDAFVHCCCCLCALTQEYRELKIRGVDPSIGWEANVKKWKQEGLTMPPVVAPGMDR